MPRRDNSTRRPSQHDATIHPGTHASRARIARALALTMGLAACAGVVLAAHAQPANLGDPKPATKAPAKSQPKSQPKPQSVEGADGARDAAKSPVPYPHPLITEVLYAPAKGDAGDADGDGVRSATGDEFVEIVNPHDRPISLRGYVITDARPTKGPGANAPNATSDGASSSDGQSDPSDQGASGSASRSGSKEGGTSGGRASGKGSRGQSGDARKPDRSRIRFTFPDVTLQPGEAAVVFNGYQTTPKGPVGSESRAPGKNENFHGAYVFSMRAGSSFAAFANAGDCVLLLAPDGRGVSCVQWSDKGDSASPEGKRPEAPAPLVEHAPICTGSVQRDGIDGSFAEHRALGGQFAGMHHSPGLFGRPQANDEPAPPRKSDAKD